MDIEQVWQILNEEVTLHRENPVLAQAWTVARAGAINALRAGWPADLAGYAAEAAVTAHLDGDLACLRLLWRWCTTAHRYGVDYPKRWFRLGV